MSDYQERMEAIEMAADRVEDRIRQLEVERNRALQLLRRAHKGLDDDLWPELDQEIRDFLFKVDHP